jgi:hypothetical protein
LSILALVIGGCSSKSSNNTDSGVDSGPVDAPMDHTTTPDVPKDTGVDKGKDAVVDTFKPPTDVRDTNGSICTGIAPTAPLISDFSSQSNATFGMFGQDPVVGGTYVSPTATGLNMEDFSAMNWHISGQVFGHQDFFGIYWNCVAAASGGCTLDVSQWKGISFTISGNVGPDNAIGFTMGRSDNDTATENATCGTCVKAADAATSEDSCRGPRTTVTVPTDHTTVKTVTLNWADLTGGHPQDSLDPHQLTGILWFFHDVPADAGTSSGDAGTDGSTGPSYAVDFTIDDVKFVPF